MSRELVVDGVGMRFGGNRALSDVSVRLRTSEWLGLIGPNGSGKSTLLNVLSGVYLPTAGTVRLDGHDVTGRTARWRARNGIVRSFQHPQLARTLTLAENIAMGSDLGRRRVGRAAQLPVDDLVEALGCAGYRAHLPDEVPYGVRKTAEIARAAAGEPDFLLLDEPAAGLSAEERTDLVGALGRLREVRPTLAICLIEHDVALVRAVVDRIVVLTSGSVLTTGATDTVLSDGRVREAYLGDVDEQIAAEESLAGAGTGTHRGRAGE